MDESNKIPTCNCSLFTRLKHNTLKGFRHWLRGVHLSSSGQTTNGFQVQFQFCPTLPHERMAKNRKQVVVVCLVGLYARWQKSSLCMILPAAWIKASFILICIGTMPQWQECPVKLGLVNHILEGKLSQMTWLCDRNCSRLTTSYPRSAHSPKETRGWKSIPRQYEPWMDQVIHENVFPGLEMDRSLVILDLILYRFNKGNRPFTTAQWNKFRHDQKQLTASCLPPVKNNSSRSTKYWENTRCADAFKICRINHNTSFATTQWVRLCPIVLQNRYLGWERKVRRAQWGASYASPHHLTCHWTVPAAFKAGRE